MIEYLINEVDWFDVAKSVVWIYLISIPVRGFISGFLNGYRGVSAK
jgi:hypothetical protein